MHKKYPIVPATIIKEYTKEFNNSLFMFVFETIPALIYTSFITSAPKNRKNKAKNNNTNIKYNLTEFVLNKIFICFLLTIIATNIFPTR